MWYPESNRHRQERQILQLEMDLKHRWWQELTDTIFFFNFFVTLNGKHVAWVACFHLTEFAAYVFDVLDTTEDLMSRVTSVTESWLVTQTYHCLLVFQVKIRELTCQWFCRWWLDTLVVSCMQVGLHFPHEYWNGLGLSKGLCFGWLFDLIF